MFCLLCCSYKHRNFENTKLFAGNYHVINIFTSEDLENNLTARYIIEEKCLTVYFQYLTLPTACIKKVIEI